MTKRDHLPIYGVGPLYVCVIAALTLAAVLMRNMSLLESGRLDTLHTPLLILGVALIVAGAALWVYAVLISKIDDG